MRKKQKYKSHKWQIYNVYKFSSASDRMVNINIRAQIEMLILLKS